jgi:hypothetical protein
MQLVAAATLWSMVAAFMVFPILGVPSLLHRSAVAVMLAELGALAVWSYARGECEGHLCGGAASLGGQAAGIDVPALAVVLVVLAVADGVRRGRRAAG